jgi:tripartite-type tricarboxylate transporter receptor subunit TctC
MTKLHLALAMAATLAGTRPAPAQDWPTRPVTLVSPFGAGGVVDVVGRIVATRLAELLGKPVVVENVVGAGGMNGVSRVVKAAPDGYQVVLGTAATHAINQTLYKKPQYNAATDLAPVGLLAAQPQSLVARKNLPAGNLQEFIAFARANQAKLQYGSSGVGSASHLGCVLFNAAIKIDTTHVPYRGGGQVVQDLVAGRLDYSCASPTTVLPLIESNAINAIAVLAHERLSALPALATAREQGLSVEADNWFALFVPKATPAAIIRKLHDAGVATVETPWVQARLKEIGAPVVAPERRSTEYLRKFVVSEIEKWAAPIKASGVSMD